jgi:hypothetical protein
MQAMVEKVSAVIEGAFEGDAHTFLMAVYKNPDLELPIRVDAAKAAIRYEKPALAAMEMKAEVDNRVRIISSEPLSEDEWTTQHGDDLGTSGGAAEGLN